MRARHSSLWRAPTGWGWGELRRRGASATLALRLTVYRIPSSLHARQKKNALVVAQRMSAMKQVYSVS